MIHLMPPLELKGSEAVPVITSQISMSFLFKNHKILLLPRQIDSVDRLTRKNTNTCHHMGTLITLTLNM